MLARVIKQVARSTVPVGVRAAPMRQFSDVLAIPTDKEQQGGRRKEELDAEAAGDIGFDHDNSLVPPADQGTFANPISVRSGYATRAVGFEDPGTHQLVWFLLNEGAVHFVPHLNLHFKLDRIAGWHPPAH